MKKLFSILVLSLLLGTQAKAQITAASSIQFDVDQHQLTSEAKSELNEIARKLNNASYPLVKVRLEGHTDADGSVTYNEDLALRRVKVVRFYLMRQGIDPEKIEITHRGETTPIASNTSDHGKSLNRRVEIEWELEEPSLAEESQVKKKVYKVDDIQDHLSIPRQAFVVNAGNKTEINGLAGTKIEFPANAFEDDQGNSVQGMVDIELLEYYSKSDLIRSNMHTQSNGFLLETGGAVYISAKSDGRPVRLKENKPMKLTFSNVRGAEDMRMFAGQHGEDGMFDWWVTPSMRSSRLSFWQKLYILLTPFDRPVPFGIGKYQRNWAEVANNQKIDDVVFKSTSLGYINCDRFQSYPNKTDLIVKVDGDFKPSVKLVFRNINSVMNSYHSAKGDQYVFSNVPVGKQATLIAMSMVNDEVHFVKKEIRIQKRQSENLEMMQSTMKELEQMLVSLDD